MALILEKTANHEELPTAVVRLGQNHALVRFSDSAPFGIIVETTLDDETGIVVVPIIYGNLIKDKKISGARTKAGDFFTLNQAFQKAEFLTAG